MIVIANHMASLQIAVDDEDAATFSLRQLFVDEPTKEGCESSNFLSGSPEEISRKALEFRLTGIFDREIGDIVMKMCASVLRIPIMIITSSQSVPYVPFFPDEPLSNDPIYVAYHYYGAGHYDATKSTLTPDKSSEHERSLPPAADVTKVCNCGRKLRKSKSEAFCHADDTGQSRCPCVREKRKCSSKCRCLNCSNREQTDTFQISSCRCGEFNKLKGDSIRSSCTDTVGRRRTKCPCYAKIKGCNEECCCHDCENDYGKKENVTVKPNEKRSKKCTSSPSSLKRKRSSIFHKQNALQINQGPWTLQETCVLETVQSFLMSTSITPSIENICDRAE